MSCNCGSNAGCPDVLNDFTQEQLCLVLELCSEQGTTAIFQLRNEEDLNRDDYDSITAYNEAALKKYSICAMDIVYQPNTQQLERSGLYQEAEVTISTPTQAWYANGLTFKDIDIKRTTVILGDETYKLQEKGRREIISGTTPLFYTFGLVKN